MSTFKKWIARAAVLIGLITGGAAVHAQEVSTWDAIKDRGTLRIGVVNTPPWFVLDAQSGEWGGLGAKIGTAMAEALGVELEPVEVKWGTSIPALQSNKIDIMFFLDSTPERAAAVSFPTVPVADIALAMLVEDDVVAAKWADLNKEGISIAVPQGTSMDAYITENMTNAEVLRFPSNAEAVAAFQSGRANATSMFLPPLVMLQSKIGRGKIVIPEPAHASSTGLAMRTEDDRRFFDWVGSSIFYWYHTGKIDDWFQETLVDLEIDSSSVPAMVRSRW